MLRKLTVDMATSLAAVTAISLAIGGVLSLWQIGNLTVLYIPAILWLAARRGRTAALLGSVEAFLVYDWFFVVPFHTFEVGQPQEWISLGVLLTVALVTGEAYGLLRRQTHQLASQAHLLAEHDRHTQLLY